MKNFMRNLNQTLDQHLPPAAKTILLLNVIVFLILQFFFIFSQPLADFLLRQLGQTPVVSLRGFHVWQFLTYMFVQFDPFHLLFNMLALWFFAPPLENRWGTRTFWRFFLIVGIGAALFQALLALTVIPHENPRATVIGASGAIMGILLAYAAYYPNNIVIFFIFPMKVKYLVMIYVAMAFLFLSRPGGGISNLTHLGGLAAAYLWLALHHRDWDIRHWQWTRSWR